MGLSERRDTQDVCQNGSPRLVDSRHLPAVFRSKHRGRIAAFGVISSVVGKFGKYGKVIDPVQAHSSANIVEGM